CQTKERGLNCNASNAAASASALFIRRNAFSS
ncbi:MAG: hypothetical protein ACI8VR_002107, partial [Candidatus Azotimanducaceae bacterium]